MKSGKRETLEKAGWSVGSAAEFLGLSPAEEAFVELKLNLAGCLRDHRTSRDLSQTEVARRLGSSQSRIAKMEAADATVSLDLLIRALLTLGASNALLARAMVSAHPGHPSSALLACETPPDYETKRKDCGKAHKSVARTRRKG